MKKERVAVGGEKQRLLLEINGPVRVEIAPEEDDSIQISRADHLRLDIELKGGVIVVKGDPIAAPTQQRVKVIIPANLARNLLISAVNRGGTLTFVGLSTSQVRIENLRADHATVEGNGITFTGGLIKLTGNDKTPAYFSRVTVEQKQQIDAIGVQVTAHVDHVESNFVEHALSVKTGCNTPEPQLSGKGVNHTSFEADHATPIHASEFSAAL